MNKTYAINQAITFLIQRGYAQRVIKAASYDGIRATYWLAIYDSVEGYLTNGGRVTSYKATAQRAVADAFFPAAEIAYQEAGAELPLDEDTYAWLIGRQNEELGYIDQLFQDLKDNRDNLDPAAEALRRAESYAQTLDAIYSEANMRGQGNQLLEWVYGDTDHCSTCESLNGQKHKASWYLSRNYIPGKPGAGMDCGGYRCQCLLLDKKGNEVTI